jgi:threonine dehydrogenase-like Zn-dependent dehydrogenase
MSREFGGPFRDIDLDRLIVPGHEYVGEILDYGPGCRRRLRKGTRVTSLPVIHHGSGQVDIVGHSNNFPGGFGEYMLLDEDLLVEIPTALDDDMAAMTEPLSVGLEHARIGNPTRDDVPLVVGCGAIGLAVIAGLKLMNASPIIAADLAPARRAAALKMGADVVIDPRELSPYAPVHALGMRRATLIYECVGQPGMLDEITRSVGHGARIIMGGFCLETEHLFVPCAQMKRLRIDFAGGEEQQDFDLALRAIGDGTVDVGAWIGARIGLSGVGEALGSMSDPRNPIRTVVDPRVNSAMKQE